MKRQKTLLKLQLREEAVMSRPFPPFGNPLWQARKGAPRGTFLQSADADGFIFRLSFADSDVDARYQTPDNLLMHGWNSGLMHVPQLTPTDPENKTHNETDLKLTLYWLRARKPRGEGIADPENIPNGLQKGSTLRAAQLGNATHALFPDIKHVAIDDITQNISASSIHALQLLRNKSSALQLTADVNLWPVPNAMMRSTDTRGLQHYQSAGVCSVYCKCIRFPRSNETNAGEDADDTSGNDASDA